MILTIAEDFTSVTALDTELTSVPDSGMYLNSGVHPSITVNNLLAFLPNLTLAPADFAGGTTYGKYTTSRLFTDIVIDSGIIYQSLTASNTGNTPASSPTNWLPTTLDALRIKSFVLRSQDHAIAKINLTRRLVDNQFLYNIVEVEESPQVTLLPNDFAAWVFEPRGSDYVKFRVNQIALQATTVSTVDLFVINQGVLIDTIVLNPNLEGRLVFEDVNFEFSGKGKFFFAIAAQNVLTNGAVIDPLLYDGFVAYTATGIGSTAESADYNIGVSNNGLSFNITTYFDSTVYTDNNLQEFANYLQAAWELDVLNMFLSNAHNRSNRDQRIQVDKQMLIAETKELKAFSVANKFLTEKKQAIRQLEKTFDREINSENEGFEIELGSV